MKRKKPIIKILSVIGLLFFLMIIIVPLSSAADDKDKNKDKTGSSLPQISNPIANPELAVRIPGLVKLSNVTCTQSGGTQECTIPWLAEYMTALYKYGISIISIIAVVVIMFAGVIWITAAGNDKRISDAKTWISGGLFGILISLSAYMILNIINPALVKLSPIKITSITKEDLPGFEDYKKLLSGNISQLEQATGNIKTIKVETKSGDKWVQVDESIEKSTQATFTELKNAGFNVYEVGGYRASPYCHGKGLAIDVDVKANYCIDCYGEKGAKVGSYFRPAGPGDGTDYTKDDNSLTKEAVAIFKKNGWCWGGDWKKFKDYMHFSTPTCRNGAECGASGQYDFSKSVKENHKNLGISYP